MKLEIKQQGGEGTKWAFYRVDTGTRLKKVTTKIGAKSEAEAKAILIKAGYEEYAPAPTIQPNDEIWYTTSNGQALNYANYMQQLSEVFQGVPYLGPDIISDTYVNGRGVIKFASAVTKTGADTETEEGFYPIFSGKEITEVPISEITSISFPDSVTESLEYTCGYVPTITQCKLSNNVTKLHPYTCLGCACSEITIPASVTEITGMYVLSMFKYNSETEETEEVPWTLISYSTIPPTVDDLNFLGTVTGSEFRMIPTSIKVPAESVDAYKNAFGWSQFADIITAIS